MGASQQQQQQDSACGAGYLRPYVEAVKQFGPGFESTLWASREGQVARFDVMIDLAGDFAGCTILDIGCGNGAFAEHLHHRGIGFARYVGIDAVPELIECACSKRIERAEFRAADIVQAPHLMDQACADYVCISGALNTMSETDARHVVERAFQAARQAVVFNFLSNRVRGPWATKDLGPSHRFDTLAWLDWSLTQSRLVSFSQEYLDGHDATILIRHDDDMCG